MMNGYFALKFGGISITRDLQLELKQFGIDNTSIQTGVFHPEKRSNLKKPKVIADDVLPPWGSMHHCSHALLPSTFKNTHKVNDTYPSLLKTHCALLILLSQPFFTFYFFIWLSPSHP